jgi:uncharacterized protein YdhG (YjbR/CyaY superfamily)
MEKQKTGAGTVDEYIDGFPIEIQTILLRLRAVIHAAAPEATERISYQMPTYYLNGNLVHFAAFKHHIGFYPTPSAVAGFNVELAGYKNAKGSIQFPIDQPLPYDLIERMVRFRVEENLKQKPKRK